MRTEARLACTLLATAGLLLAGDARGEEDGTAEAIEALERRIEELEADRDGSEEPGEAQGDAFTLADLGLADWARRVKLGGSANTGYYWGEDDSVLHDKSFQIWDARFFIDAELGEDVRVGGVSLIRNVGFSFEWDLVRLGSMQNEVGELFVDFQGLGESSWANLQVGRFQIPVGENYLRFSKGYSDNPFITNTAGGPWFWDEGVKLYGSDPDNRFGYVASVMDGETQKNVDRDEDFQYTLKLWADPTSWLHLSLSGMVQGNIGSNSSPAEGALWLGESWARAFGSRTTVDNFVNGGRVPDGPNRIENSSLIGADAIGTWPEVARLWLAYGTMGIDQKGGLYDRRLHYWIAELVLEGALLHPEASPFYLGLRGSGLGTYDSDEGHLLDFRYRSSLGYNMKSIELYSVVLGWRMLRYVTLRAEYTHGDIDLVRGVTPEIRSGAQDLDSWAIEVGIHF